MLDVQCCKGHDTHITIELNEVHAQYDCGSGCRVCV